MESAENLRNGDQVYYKYLGAKHPNFYLIDHQTSCDKGGTNQPNIINLNIKVICNTYVLLQQGLNPQFGKY